MANCKISSMVVAALFTSLFITSGCGKKAPEPMPVQTVESRLQVTSVNPSTIDADSVLGVKVYGSAFQAGASVTLTGEAGVLSGSKVEVLDGNTLVTEVPALAVGAYDVTVTNPDGEESTLRSGLFAQSAINECRSVTVYFDFDRSSVRSDASSTLDDKLSCFQRVTGAIQIDGHTDARGTTDYNLALGQRRADAVQRYLTNGGVGSSRVSTTSYGEESAAVQGSGESAWSKNRRAEISASQ